MGKKIVVVHGGPRKKGNTRAITKITVDSARKHGAKVDEIDAINLTFKAPGCIACFKCQESEEYKCIIDDEVAAKVATLPSYDVIVLSAPIYWWSYPAQLKIFIDRIFSLIKLKGDDHISALSGKTMALIATGGGELENNLNLLEAQWRNPADMMGCKFLSSLYPDVLPEEGFLTKNPDAVQKAKEFGRLLAME
ncbi:MAG: NAD(P)H-dependent oxidoreductase [Deltaproteobacteria bacterium]|nr:NAD(P)H-dependent oxidoreductase [Deltaproteobacteria bacterium]